MSAEPSLPTSQEQGSGGRRSHLTLLGDPSASAQSSRRPLSPQLSLKTTSNRWRVFLALGSMLVALLTVLGLSIVMAERQYELVELRSQEQALTQQNEALIQEVEFYQAPQNLAIRASQLGLVAASSQATLDLQTGQISGTPLVAEKLEDAPKNLISPPALADTQAYEQASIRAEEERKKEEAAAKASASASASPAPAASASPAASQTPTPAASASQAPSASPAASAGN